jgi:hypothetical protein
MATIFNLNANPVDVTTVAKTRDSALFFLKENLVSLGWTVLSSSDGTTYSPSTDLWASIANIGSTAHVLLVSPVGIITGGTGKVWLMLGSSATAANATVTAHNTLPTGGTSSVFPTSTEVLAVLSNSSFINNSLNPNNKFNFVGWDNGAFSMLNVCSGNGGFSNIISAYPLSDISNTYPYAIAFKSTNNNGGGARLIASHLDTPKLWNRNGIAALASGKINYLSNSSGNAVGFANPGTGDAQGNHHQSNIYLYNINPAQWERIGKIGRDGYDFAISGETALALGSVNAIPTTNVVCGDISHPANAVISF